MVVAGMHYESNWVVGVRSSMESAKRLAQEKYGVQMWRTGEVTAGTATETVTGLIADGISFSWDYASADFVTIAEWKVEP